MSDFPGQTDINEDAVLEEEQYEGTPDELTSFKPVPGVSFFNRKKVMIMLSAALSVIVLFGVIFSGSKSRSRRQSESDYSYAASAPEDFLKNERDRSLRRPLSIPDDIDFEDGVLPDEEEAVLPDVVPVDLRDEQAPPVQQEAAVYGMPPPQFVANFSPLVPQVAGSLLSGGAATTPPSQQSQAVDPYADLRSSLPPSGTQDPYALQNNQANKTNFYNSVSGGALSGSFLPSDILWIGTMIPAVLETAINTDLPGNVIARVTQNVYDSHTGKKLLIPQGTILIAQYNSSISYAQSRVQIVWDLLIRPDGYEIKLEGMNGVDPKGMAGLKATYNENWFEYVKAAGIITMFSVANAKMAEEAAKYGSSDTAAAVITQNSQFVGQVGGNIIGRAMNIQPTLTVESGEKINIMLNKNIYLPPMQNIPVTQKYILP